MGILIKLIGFIVIGAIIVALFANFPEEMAVAVGLAIVGFITTVILGKK